MKERRPPTTWQNDAQPYRIIAIVYAAIDKENTTVY